MHKTFVIGDLHLGHKKIHIYSPSRRVSSSEEHDRWIIRQWNSVVRKDDTTIVLGDVAFSKTALSQLNQMNGIKHLVFGNHDKFPIAEYLRYFTKVHGFFRKMGAWLSHAPIHPHTLRGRINIHGHMHANKIVGDNRYVCVSVEQLNGIPIELKTIVPPGRNTDDEH